MPSLARALTTIPLAFALLAACSASPGSTGGDGALGASSEALTTTEALARADQWVSAKLAYCQSANHARDYDTSCSTYCTRTDNPAWDPYRSDCSGFVSWAWGLAAPGRVTSEFAPFQTDITHAIAAKDLAPGDAVNHSGHMMLFKAWVTPGARATFIEEPGCSSSTPYAHELTADVTINGDSIDVAGNSKTFTAIRYDALTPPPANRPPRGALDGASCDAIAGWSQDQDAATAPIFVDLYFDAPAGGTPPAATRVTADGHRADLCSAIGSCDHGFSLAPPRGLMDGKAHAVYAYGVDDSGKGPSTLLAGAPLSFTCAPPAIPRGVIKRWVASASVLSAWKIDRLTGVAHEPASAVDAIPRGADLPGAPLAVIADDGSPAVWVVDGDVRRHVVDRASLGAWSLTAATWPAATVSALAQAADWPASPFALAGEGAPEVYVLDTAPDAPPGTPSGGLPTAEPPRSEGAVAPTGGTGCAIGNPVRGAASNLVRGAGAVAAALALVRRRRRREQSRRNARR